MVQIEPLRETVPQKGPPQNQLIVQGVGLGGPQARETVHLETTEEIANVDQGNGAQMGHLDHALSIHLPLFVSSLGVSALGLRKLTMTLIRSGELLLFQEGGDP